MAGATSWCTLTEESLPAMAARKRLPREATGPAMPRGNEMIAKMRMTLLALPVTIMAGTAFAADAALPEPAPVLPLDTGWTFTMAPYFWMAGMEGTIGQ